MDYGYNIRAWLTRINNADITTIAPGDPAKDYFGFELGYNNAVSGLTSAGLYNGSISSIQWSKAGTAKRQGYAFGYDGMKRLTSANHFDYHFNYLTMSPSVNWEANNNMYGEYGLSFDLNGNILALSRKGYVGALIDNLTYTYSAGNKLGYVNDSGNQTAGFVNGNTGTDDYAYDANGNLTSDKNKGIAAAGIEYNHLNLSSKVSKSLSDYLVYTYDASARKLSQQVFGSAAKTTDYIGALVYEGGILKTILTDDGRVLPDGAGWEYQYDLKDHLGNVRVTFTAKTQTPISVTTDFEASTNAAFQNYNSISFDLVDHTDAAGAMYTKVQALSGVGNGRVGVAKSLAVLPGDVISATTFVKYMNLGTTSNPSVFATALASALGVSSGSTGDQLNLYNSVNTYAAEVPLGDHPGDNDSAPKGFITILLFDKNYNLLDATWTQTSTAAAQTSPSVKQPPHEQINAQITASEVGYAYVFISNENQTYVDMYFDDLTITQTPSAVVSASDYYPFGLQYNNGERTGSGTYEQRLGFNDKELQDELALNWLDYGARMYMADIGRWGVIDPLSEMGRRWSVYNYAYDNPIKFTDPDGMRPNDDSSETFSGYADVGDWASSTPTSSHEKSKAPVRVNSVDPGPAKAKAGVFSNIAKGFADMGRKFHGDELADRWIKIGNGAAGNGKAAWLWLGSKLNEVMWGTKVNAYAIGHGQMGDVANLPERRKGGKSVFVDMDFLDLLGIGLGHKRLDQKKYSVSGDGKRGEDINSIGKEKNTGQDIGAIESFKDGVTVQYCVVCRQHIKDSAGVRTITNDRLTTFELYKGGTFGHPTKK